LLFFFPPLCLSLSLLLSLTISLSFVSLFCFPCFFFFPSALGLLSGVFIGQGKRELPYLCPTMATR
jgi:hypothetical protein